MKYYIDTEFLEGTQKEKFPISLFRKNTPPTIDLISIGIVSEDGREYYAISKDFNLKEAWNRFDLKPNIKKGGMKKVYWIRENVLKPIFDELMVIYDEEYKRKVDTSKYIGVIMDRTFRYKALKWLISRYGKTNNQISEGVEGFCSIGTAYSTMDKSTSTIMHFLEQNEETLKNIKQHDLKHVFNEIPTFYAYFADYDWVAFCWLFGKMMDLPKGFPMYCNDLKQLFSEKQVDCNYDLKTDGNYPKQENEHNALADARWNKKLHEFLLTL